MAANKEIAQDTTKPPERRALRIEKDAAVIRSMFAAISPRYDLLNHVLSLNIDRSWRRRTVRALRLDPSSRVLDVCTGTADLAFELAEAVDPLQGGQVIGGDFTEEMIRIAARKRGERRLESPGLCIADTMHLPFADGSFDAVTVAFGIRNVVSLEAGLEEMLRVLRPGGQAAILEFTTPKLKVVRTLYQTYFHRVLPRVGAWLSGSSAGRSAYRYLPNSVSEFPKPDELSTQLKGCGFVDANYESLTCGVACLHLATKPVGRARPSLASSGPRSAPENAPR